MADWNWYISTGWREGRMREGEMDAAPGVRIEVVYSPHDGGYYAEVWGIASGRELRATQVYSSAAEAYRDATDWARGSGYRVE